MNKATEDHTITQAYVDVLTEAYTWSGRHAPSKDDFEEIGGGCFRTVFLNKYDGRVYKVGDCDNNRLEFANYTRLKDTELPDKVRLPVTELVEGTHAAVIIMEHIVGMPPNYDDWDGDSLEYELGVRDLHNDNIIIDEDGNIVVVDIAGY